MSTEKIVDYNIYKQGRLTTVKPEDPVLTTKNITSFACSNGLRNCIFRSQGGWYKLGMDGILVFVCRTLYLISFEELYHIMKD
jgi:hypothetical protein